MSDKKKGESFTTKRYASSIPELSQELDATQKLFLN